MEEQVKTESQPKALTEVQQEPVATQEQKQEPTETDKQDVEVPPEPQAKEEHKPNRIQKRIDKLTREKYELKGRVEALEKMIQGTQQQEQNAVPTRDKFENEDDYIAARVQYELKKSLPVLTPQSQRVEYVNVADTYNDFEEVMEDADSVTIPDDRTIHESIIYSPNRDAILYHLIKNPERAKQLFAMTPARAVAEIGKIEARFEADVEARKKPVQKQTTKASPPINPVKPSGEGVIVDLDKLSPADFVKARNAEELKRRGRLA